MLLCEKMRYLFVLNKKKRLTEHTKSFPTSLIQSFFPFNSLVGR